MKHILTRSLFLALAVQSCALLCAQPHNKKPTSEPSPYTYYGTHALTTALSFGTAYILGNAGQFIGAFAGLGVMERNPRMPDIVKMPMLAIMVYSGWVLGGFFIYKTPQWTDKHMFKQQSAYSQQEGFIHGLGHLAMFAALYRFGNINALKAFIFKLRNG
jgi:hypothetical protein